jgi:nicotinamidase-related amidase
MAEFPTYYEPTRIGTLFYPDMARIAQEAAAANLPPASEDMQKVHLVIVDMQVDFCHEQGSLYVPGAGEDIRRTIEFIFRNAGRITQISCSLDSHVPSQIFSPNWWLDAAGNHPAPFTLISAEDVDAGRWQPVREPEWSLRYVHTLEREAKKQLTIWPYHVLIGSPGHGLDAELWSAVFWHSVARQVQPHWLSKGSVPRTEHYSIIQPEVPVVDHPGGGKNQAFLQLLAQANRVIIVGEAASHCVLETLEDLVEEFRDRPEMLNRLTVLEDCTSPVVHPEIDFGAMARERFAQFQREGVRIARSTDPLPEA